MPNGEMTIHHMTPELVNLGGGTVHNHQCVIHGTYWSCSDEQKTCKYRQVTMDGKTLVDGNEYHCSQCRKK